MQGRRIVVRADRRKVIVIRAVVIAADKIIDVAGIGIELSDIFVSGKTAVRPFALVQRNAFGVRFFGRQILFSRNVLFAEQTVRIDLLVDIAAAKILRPIFKQFNRVFEHPHRAFRIVHLHKVARKIIEGDGIRRIGVYRAVEHIAHVFDLRAKVFVFGRKRPVQFVEEVSAHLRPIVGIERFRFGIKLLFELQHFAEVIRAHEIAHHAREVAVDGAVQLHEGCVLFARFFEFGRIFFGRPLEVNVAEQKDAVGIVHVIIEDAPPGDLFGLFIICQIVAFHARVFDARFLIVVKIIQDIAVHPFRSEVLFSFAVCARIFEKPLFLQLHARGLIKERLRLRIFVRLNERISLLVQAVRSQRLPDKIARKNY